MRIEEIRVLVCPNCSKEKFYWKPSQFMNYIAAVLRGFYCKQCGQVARPT